MAARNPFASSVPDIYDPYASPYSRRAPLSTGYYFIRNLLMVGGVCGVLVAAYRNDLLLELARRVGMESRYLAAEQYFVGTPGWGTPRSMGPVLNPAEPAPKTEDAVAAPVPSVTNTEPVAAAPAAPTPAAAEQRSPSPAAEPAPARVAPTPLAGAPAATVAAPVAMKATLTDPLTPVSLDSLPVLNKGSAPARTVVEAPASRPAAPAAVARSVAPAAVRPTPSPVPRANGKAANVTLDDDAPSAAAHRSASHRAEPAPAPVAAKPAPPAGPKATDVHKNDNPLMAAVRSAVKARPPKD